MYATVDDMIEQFGEAEMIRLSAPEGQLDELVNRTRVERALTDASALIDGYLRRRYALPLPTTPAEVARCCRDIARHDLAKGEQKSPTEQMKDARKEAMDWLRDVADRRVDLDLAAATDPASADARVADRDAAFTNGASIGW